jgi:RimJ/RimL family protein N-acetyltransferase
VKAREQILTERLLLRRPLADDADAIFARYAADPEVTRLLSWPTHRTVAATKQFLVFSDAEWREWPAGPYLILSRADRRLLGGTGLAFETPDRASTGYVLAKDAWGNGYATEALNAMVNVARDCGVRRLYAICHTDHAASARVLEKCGFVREGRLRKHTEFPNYRAGDPCDVFCYARAL